MTRPRSLSTRAAAALAILLLLTGCTPAPQPSPTPTPLFASEDEAFAAAEATYREFTARLNEVDTTDPHTFEPLFDLSSGSFEEADRKAYSAMHAEGITISGETRVVSFAGRSYSPAQDRVTAEVCLDVSSVTVTGANGDSRVDPARPDVYGLTVTFVAESERLTINEARADSEVTC